VTSIGRGAISDCGSLKSVTFKSNTPPAIGDDVFGNCPNLKTIYVPAGAKSAYKKVFTGYTIKEK